MNPATDLEPIPPRKPGLNSPRPNGSPRPNSYRAEDIVAEYGTLANFMAAVGPKAPLEIPDLGFSEAEERRMNQLLAEENAAADNL